MPQLRAFSEYFEEHPPLHLVVAALAGVQPRRSGGEQIGSATTMAFDALLANSTLAAQGASDGQS